MSHQSITIRTEIDLAPGQAWDYFFNQINRWWNKEHLTNPRTKKLVIQTFIGGHMYEDFGEGEGLIWGEVIGVNYPNSLSLKGYLSPEFGGPAISYDKYLFQENKGSTILEFRSDYIGHVSSKTIEALEAGWVDIFHRQFKPFCEK